MTDADGWIMTESGLVPEHAELVEVLRDEQRRAPAEVLKQFPMLKQITFPERGERDLFAVRFISQDVAYQLAFGFPVEQQLFYLGPDFAWVMRDALEMRNQDEDYLAVGLTGPRVLHGLGSLERREIRRIIELPTGREIYFAEPTVREALHPYDRVAVVCFKDNLQSDPQVWAIKPSDRNFWCLPGGHIDPGELPVDAAVREMQEETGIQCRIVGYLGVIPSWWSTTYVFLGVAQGQDEPSTPDEIQDLGAVALQDLTTGERLFIDRRLMQIHLALTSELTRQFLEKSQLGRWVTMSGNHVFIRDGKVVYGPKHLVGMDVGDKFQPKRSDRPRSTPTDRSGKYVKGAYGGHTMTGLGNLGEAVVESFMEKVTKGPYLHVSAGKFKAFPIDMFANGNAVEIKTFSIQSSRHEIRMSQKSLTAKHEVAKFFGKKPLMVAVIIDHKTGTASIFKKSGFARYPLTSMEQVGTIKITSKIRARAKVVNKPTGAEATFKLLADAKGSTPEIEKWRKRASSFAQLYAKKGTSVA